MPTGMSSPPHMQQGAVHYTRTARRTAHTHTQLSYKTRGTPVLETVARTSSPRRRGHPFTPQRFALRTQWSAHSTPRQATAGRHPTAVAGKSRSHQAPGTGTESRAVPGLRYFIPLSSLAGRRDRRPLHQARTDKHRNRTLAGKRRARGHHPEATQPDRPPKARQTRDATHHERPGDVAAERAGTQQQAAGAGDAVEVEGGENPPPHELQVQVHRLVRQSAWASSSGGGRPRAGKRHAPGRVHHRREVRNARAELALDVLLPAHRLRPPLYLFRLTLPQQPEPAPPLTPPGGCWGCGGGG